MRCSNCGWDNAAHNAQCEKCGAPIINANESEEFHTPESQYPKRFDPSKTAEGCAECGYPVRFGDTSCPNCGISFGGEIQEPPRQEPTPPRQEPTPPRQEPTPPISLEGTIPPWKMFAPTSACSLSLITRDGEEPSKSSLEFSGDVIQLNRGNTEPNNQTITSKVQAELTFENGAWYIQDKSALKTTYVYVGDKVELKQGDTILLGNRLFLFNCQSVT